ncbi:MAG: hypothetical protein IJZ19_10630 [Lentisphaeria bacterium]|nr:hypothetical protein [Lentisphaeria bacterium]
MQNAGNNYHKVSKCLSEDRMEAMRDLHINPTHKRGRDESPIFLLYLNYAVNNILDITKISKKTSSNGVKNALLEKQKQDPQVFYKLANFFWLFTADEPQKNFPDYKERTIELAKKIFELRDYFAHLNQSGVKPLTVDVEMYRFIGGVLYSQALENSILTGLRTAKLFKMKLFAVRNKDKQIYDFTRRGLVFLISMALYKDEAHEFTQCLEDMKLPACPRGMDSADACPCDCEDIATCKPRVAKAFVKMFTYFSARRGRSVNLLEDDLNYMSFADISGYLNKVPAAAMDYLTLDKENSMLRGKYEKSTESEENKKYKYSLHKRSLEKFLSFAVGYCEDFDKLPALKFKRLDISEHEGRKRYFFGKEHDNRAHMDRHYQIKQNAIGFAWFPKKHYGDIHIDSLRSSISASTLKELLYASFKGENINRVVDDYFTAYHRILETILNIPDPNDIYLEGKLLEDFAAVANVNPALLEEDIAPLERYFSDNLLRFFTGDDSTPDASILQKRLKKRFQNQLSHAEDFVVRLHKFNQWKEELGKLREKNPDAKLTKPTCDSKEVKNPPRNCDISDAVLIHWVFNYFNLFLTTNEQKFRQLPQGEQHRGPIDFEYQTVHALIGKYSLDPRGLKYYIETKKKELCPAWDQLIAAVKKLQKEEAKKRPPKLNKFGKPILPSASLSMLAEAAAVCYGNFFSNKLNLLQTGVSSKKLKELCRDFKVRTGMPLDRNSLIKTILRIDLGNWMHAYDYENRANFENRSLSDNGHIVSQIPFPNDFAQRVMVACKNPEERAFIREADGKVHFDFNAAFLQMQPEIALRDFYDTAPLVTASYALKSGTKLSEIPGLRNSWDEGFEPDLSRNAINSAIVSIKESRNQDKILLKIAYAYWNKFQSAGSFICSGKKSPKSELAETPSIYEYFNTEVQLKFPDDDRKILLQPNDVNRPTLSQIQAYAPDIAKVMDPEGKQQEFEFYEMMKQYRIIQAKDRVVRLTVIPLMAAFDSAVVIPDENYEKGGDNRSMAFEFFVKKYPGLSRSEFDTIVNLRNAVFHCGINLQMNEVDQILRKYVTLPAPAVKKMFKPNNNSGHKTGNHFGYKPNNNVKRKKW